MAGLAASLMRQWRESQRDPVVLWIRALEMGRTKRFSGLLSDLPIAGEELQAWLRLLLGLVQEQELDPVRALALVAGRKVPMEVQLWLEGLFADGWSPKRIREFVARGCRPPAKVLSVLQASRRASNREGTEARP